MKRRKDGHRRAGSTDKTMKTSQLQAQKQRKPNAILEKVDSDHDENIERKEQKKMKKQKNKNMKTQANACSQLNTEIPVSYSKVQ